MTELSHPTRGAPRASERGTAPVGPVPERAGALGRPERLLLGALVLSPFQQAFTVDIGFPLKPSEILVGLAVLTLVLGPRRRARGAGRLESRLVLVLLVLTVLSVLVRLVTQTPTAEVPGMSRSLTADIVLYLGYTTLVVALWFLTLRVTSERLRRAFVAAVWTCGLATLAQWVLWGVGAVEVLEALSYQTARSGIAFGVATLRAGPFVEGNHLGFFAAVGLFVCLRERRLAAAAVAAGCLVYSQSTSALVSLVLGIAVLLVGRSAVMTHVRVLVGGALGLVVLVLVPAVRRVVLFQAAKIGVFGTTLAEVNQRSVTLRGEKAELAWRIALDNPGLGVGPGRFAVWFFEYAGPEALPGTYLVRDARPIVENAYMQLAAEVGLVALAVFVLLVVTLMVRGFRSSSYDAAIAAVVGLSAWTLSSWTFMPFWFAIAYLASLAAEPRDARPVPSVSSPPRAHGVTTT